MAAKKKSAKTSQLDALIHAELQKLNVSTTDGLKDLGVFEFLVSASPHLESPDHLAAVVPFLEAIEEGPRMFCFSAPPRHGKPLSGATLVTMSDGTLRPLRDVQVGDRVIGGHGRPTRVLHKFEQGVLDVYKITTYLGREIVAEGSHRFLTNEGWKRVDELRPYNKTNWQRPRGHRLTPLGDYAFEETYLDPEEARFLGYMVGDGSCGQYQRGGTTTLACGFTNAEPEVIARFTQSVSHLGGDVTCLGHYHYGVRGGMRDVLRKHELAGKTSHTKVVPRAVFSAQREAVLAFIAGYMETDGRRGEHDQTSFCSVSRELLLGVQHLLTRLGIRSALRLKNGTYKGERHVSWRLSVHDEQKFFDIVPVCGPRGGAHGRSRRNEGIGDTVVSVEPAGREECFCIMVEESSSFLANGVVTHNSVAINHFVARQMLRHPGLRVAYGCYSLDLSMKFSEDIKDIFNDIRVDFDREHNSKEYWRLKNGSSFKAVAPGSGFTGRGADLIVIDDPYKNRATAESGKIREEVYNWFKSVAITRRSPNASVIVTHCIAKGERILMGDGSWKAIEEIAPGEMVASYDGEKLVPQRVLAQKSSGIDPIFEVRTERSSFRANSRHPVLAKHHRNVPRPAWVKVQDLSRDLKIALPRGLDVAGSCEFTEDFMWLFGFMLGDGWLTNHRNGASWAVCVAKSEYPELNAKVVRLLETELRCRVYDTEFGYVRADCNAAGRLLSSLGLHKKAKQKSIPDWVFDTCSVAQRRALLDGLLEADGHYVKKTPHIRILGVSSRELAEGAVRLARTCYVRASKARGDTQRVKPPHSKDFIDSTIYRCNFTFESSEGEPLRWERIQSVTPCGESEVYDLTVENTENFVCEGVVVHNTRWHPEDLTGIAVREHNIPLINLPAIDETGAALWPSQWPRNRLDEIRKIIGEYDWSSLYMGDPVPRGGAVFGDPTTYTADEFASAKIVKYVIGIDCAYSKKTHSDYSVAVVLAIAEDGTHYVVDVRRVQDEAPAFAAVLKELRLAYNSPAIYWYVGGIEKSVVDLFRNSFGIPINAMPAKEDKFVRAQAVAAAWNSRKVKVPVDDTPWLRSFLSEVLTFSGLDDPHDDQVDALAAGFIPATKPRIWRGMGETPLMPF